MRSTNRIELEVLAGRHGAIELTVDGEGRGDLAGDHDNRFVCGLEAALRAARGDLSPTIGWRISMHNQIPLSRGLGSSAAATVAGVVAGNALAGDALTIPEQLRLATDIEHHPDNAAAVLLGGFVVCAGGPGGVEAIRFDAPRDLRAVLFIPDLPPLDERDAGDAAGRDPDGRRGREPRRGGDRRGGLATGRFDILSRLTVDRLHEPYRAAAYPQLPRLVDAARRAGALGACLSGAGSTILAFADSMAGITRIEAAFVAAAADTDLPGRVTVVEPRNTGARVVARA